MNNNASQKSLNLVDPEAMTIIKLYLHMVIDNAVNITKITVVDSVNFIYNVENNN